MHPSVRARRAGARVTIGAVQRGLGGRGVKRGDCAGLTKPGAKRRRRGRHQAGAGARSGARLFGAIAP